MGKLTKINLTLWLGIIPIVSALIGGIAYLFGNGYNSAYLREFDIESSAFPGDKYERLVEATDAWPSGLTAVDQWIHHHWSGVLIWVVVMSIGIVVWSLITQYSDRRAQRQKNEPTKQDGFWVRHPTIRRCATAVAIFVLVLYMLFFAPRAAIMFSIPGVMGQEVGTFVALDMKPHYQVSCDQSEHSCYSIAEKGREVACGYPIAQSSNRIALYFKGRMTELSTDGVVIKSFGKGRLMSEWVSACGSVLSENASQGLSKSKAD
ncbi:hypothetical protein WM40_14010 [Robbsia andropogonis]|uniref:Transmembrane protein n=2 Tax=Robbsia andropogonis TaxID=28092 RepID=A0A0F5K009_9BURK|nr:hypothetical protein [Robbsia andropogonis]KKB62897.1 hypothetical protein WM40_14010 [Robbsia andropogonis]